jgi:hypothetical protein
MTDIASQLAQELAEVTWTDLIPHAKRDAIIVVTAGLDLVTVGTAIAQDEVLQVHRWIQEALIHKPLAEQLADWNQTPSCRFQTLIVQPYVLVIPLSEAV